MRHIANIRLGLVEFLLLVGGALTWTSCINDNIDYDMDYDTGYDMADNEEEQVTVRLNISAGQSGGISVSRADFDDEYAYQGEYMNTLCVFVVNSSNEIEAKFCTLEDGSNILSENEDANDGNLTDWKSGDFTLPAGEKTVYAFSNWGTVANNDGDDAWSQIIAKEVGQELLANDLAIDINDPASMVNIEAGKYIPMSGSSPITVMTDGESFDVSMDRLVGRVEVTIYGETGDGAEDITLSTFTFGGCADIVPLMKVGGGGNEDSETDNNNTYEIDLDGEAINAATDGENANSYTFYFYVNETYLGEDVHFEISLSTIREGGESSYNATTQTTRIQRNCILPINLYLSPYTLDLEVHAYASAIDTEEIEYTNETSDENDDCSFYLLDVTTMFTMTPAIKDPDGTEVSEVKWTWEKTGSTENDNIEISEPDDNGMFTFTNLTATTGHEYTFSLTAEWTTDQGVTQKRTYNIQITLVNGRPQYNAAPASSSWQGWYWNIERLNMYRKH